MAAHEDRKEADHSACGAEDMVVAVQDGSGSALRPLNIQATAIALNSLSLSSKQGQLAPVTQGGRRLHQGEATRGPSAAPLGAEQASVSALGRKDEDADGCTGFSWDLLLQPGQNNFRITAMRNGQPVSSSFICLFPQVVPSL